MAQLNTFPGVYFEVIDQSAYTMGAGVDTKIGLVCDTIRGPADEWVKVTSWPEFENTFGGLSTETYGGFYYGPTTAKTILSATKELWVYRLLSGTSAEAYTADVSDPAGIRFRLLSSGGNGSDQTYDPSDRPVYLVEASQTNASHAGSYYNYDIYVYMSDQYDAASDTSLTGLTFNGSGFFSSDASSDKAVEVFQNVSFLKDPTSGQSVIDAIGLYGGGQISNHITMEIHNESYWTSFNLGTGDTWSAVPLGCIHEVPADEGGIFVPSTIGTGGTAYGFENGDGSRYGTDSRDLADHDNVNVFADGFDILLMPDAHLSTTETTGFTSLATVAEGFGGLAVVSSGDNSSASDVIDDGIELNTSFAAMYTPWMKLYNDAMKKLVDIPPEAWAVRAMVETDKKYWPWFAPAGSLRGIVTNADPKYGWKDGDNEDIYDGNVNVIRSLPKVGPLIWGQKTTQKALTSLNRVNVRRLMTYLRKKVKEMSAAFLFEPNDSGTWGKLKSQIDSLLEVVKTERGVYDYLVVIDETTNTADVIDRNEMRGKIFLKPTKTAEVITMSFIIAGSGASFEE